MSKIHDALELNRRQLLGAAALSSVGLVPVAAAAAGKSSTKPQSLAAFQTSTDTLNLHIELTPPTLWPVNATDRSSTMIFEFIYSALVRYDENLAVQPHLAESFEISPDATTFKFTLREGVTWHDGEPVTAEDVAYTVSLHLHPESGSLYYGSLKDIVGTDDYYDGHAESVSGIEIVDDRTVSFTLTDPNVTFAGILTAIYIVPKHIFGDKAVAEMANSKEAQNPIGTGPYKFARYETDQFYQFDINKDYFLGAPNIQTVYMKIAKADVALVMLERGEIDYIADLPPADIENVKQFGNATVLSGANYTWVWAIIPNLKDPLLQDKRVRQALLYGLDRQGYIDAILLGQGTVLNHLVGPLWAWAPEDEINTYPYDPEKAKALLEEAGWDSSNVVQVVFYPGNKSRDQLPIIAQQQWKQIGFEVDVISMDVARFLERWQTTGEWQMAVSGGGAIDPEANRMAFYSGLQYPKGNNNNFYSNSEVDELFDAGKVETDPEARAKIYQRMDVILNDELPWMPICLPNYVSAASTRIQNQDYNPNRGRYFDIEKWSLSS